MDNSKQVSVADAVADARRMATTATGRNDPCACGSGMKFKRCCGRHVNPPKPGARFDQMDSRQRREFQNGLGSIVEANLPPGPSPRGRALFSLIVWDNNYAGYVSNCDRDGQAEALSIAAQQMRAQGDQGVIDYTSGTIPMVRHRAALAKLFYACHALANCTRDEREAMQINYDEALAEAGVIVNEDQDDAATITTGRNKAGAGDNAGRSGGFDPDQGKAESDG